MGGVGEKSRGKGGGKVKEGKNQRSNEVRTLGRKGKRLVVTREEIMGEEEKEKKRKGRKLARGWWEAGEEGRDKVNVKNRKPEL